MEEILDFVNKKYSKEFILERVKVYLDRSKKVDEFVAKKDYKNAIELFREVKNEMGKEAKAYSRIPDSKAIKNDEYAMKYKKWLVEAHAHFVGRITRENVFSYNYDLQDYAGVNFTEF